MVKAVQELESGIDAEIVVRNHGISKATLYNWKSKYSGMEVSQVRGTTRRCIEYINRCITRSAAN